jgi:hypothetical protein
MVLELALRGDATSKSVRSWTDGSIRCVSTLRWTYMTPISLGVGPCKLERNHNLKKRIPMRLLENLLKPLERSERRCHVNDQRRVP